MTYYPARYCWMFTQLICRDEPEELEGYEGLDEKETTERMIEEADQLPGVQDKV